MSYSNCGQNMVKRSSCYCPPKLPELLFQMFCLLSLMTPWLKIKISSPVKMNPLGCKKAAFKHVLSFKHQVYMFLDSPECTKIILTWCMWVLRISGVMNTEMKAINAWIKTWIATHARLPLMFLLTTLTITPSKNDRKCEWWIIKNSYNRNAFILKKHTTAIVQRGKLSNKEALMKGKQNKYTCNYFLYHLSPLSFFLIEKYTWVKVSTGSISAVHLDWLYKSHEKHVSKHSCCSYKTLQAFPGLTKEYGS